VTSEDLAAEIDDIDQIDVFFPRADDCKTRIEGGTKLLAIAVNVAR
jgi:hypothetical protein